MSLCFIIFLGVYTIFIFRHSVADVTRCDFWFVIFATAWFQDVLGNNTSRHKLEPSRR